MGSPCLVASHPQISGALTFRQLLDEFSLFAYLLLPTPNASLSENLAICGKGEGLCLAAGCELEGPLHGGRRQCEAVRAACHDGNPSRHESHLSMPEK
jgi:hypothetical protein